MSEANCSGPGCRLCWRRRNSSPSYCAMCIGKIGSSTPSFVPRWSLAGAALSWQIHPSGRYFQIIGSSPLMESASCFATRDYAHGGKHQCHDADCGRVPAPIFSYTSRPRASCASATLGFFANRWRKAPAYDLSRTPRLPRKRLCGAGATLAQRDLVLGNVHSAALA